MSEQKLRSEDVIERATLDQKQMQYLYTRRRGLSLHGYRNPMSSSPCLPETLGDAVGVFESPRWTIERGVLRRRASRYRVTADGRPQGGRNRSGDQGLHGDPISSSRPRSKPASSEQVPPFVDEGDLVRISTETGEYLAPRCGFVSRRPPQPPGPTCDRPVSRWTAAFSAPIPSPAGSRSSWQHVQRQERGADTTTAARPDRAATGPGL